MRGKTVTLSFWEEDGIHKGYRIYEGKGIYRGFRVKENSENPGTYQIFSGLYSEDMTLPQGIHENLEDVIPTQFKGDQFYAFIKADSLAHDYINGMVKIIGPIHIEDLTLPSIHKANLSAQIQ